MNKKCLIVLLVLVLVISGLFASESGFKVGGQVGWGFDIARANVKATDKTTTYMTKNNGFAFNLLGEYDFNKNWGVRANLGMMLAGKTKGSLKDDDGTTPINSKKRAGIYFDFTLDGKYTFVINEKLSASALLGMEVVGGQLFKDLYGAIEATGQGIDTTSFADSNFYNVGFGVNLGVEGAYNITENISIVGGATGAWFFVNSAKFIDTLKEGDDVKVSAASFYIRPYVGATYAF